MGLSESVENSLVYKVMARDDWDAACRVGVYRGSQDDLRDGFIHFSAGAQLSGTLKKYFSGHEGLVLIAFSAEGLGDPLKWEASRGGALFPHLYGELAPNAALWVRDLKLGPDGCPIVPGDVL